MLEKYVSKGSKKLRCGFTTGTCAAAASAGAARMLLSGKVIENITVINSLRKFCYCWAYRYKKRK